MIVGDHPATQLSALRVSVTLRSLSAFASASAASHFGA
jgi:hypothetical protein